MRLVIIQPQLMMELIKQKLIKTSGILLILILYCSCQEVVQDRKLECLLESIKVDLDAVEIEVGQHNGWTDSTALILITYYEKPLKTPTKGNLKGLYNGKNIYYYQSVVDSLDNKKYNQIPNSIIWSKFIPVEMDKDFISPPYDPINIQVRSEEHTSELQSRPHLVCRLL